jgi:DNA invertase Pin-like site-specific DNA recombinase
MAKRNSQPSDRSSLLYLRVSTLEQLKGVSLEAQEERLRAYCQMNGLEVHPGDVIREEGVSASVPLHKRPGGARLLQRVSEGVSNLIALKLDRVFRDAEDALRQTKAWDRAGVVLHLIDMGGASLNTASAMGRMLLTCMAGFAELERNLVSERTALSLAHKRQHRQVFNHAPYGFEVVGTALVENPAEIAIVNLIRERREDGWTLGMIADALNEDHVPTKIRGRWYARTVKNLLDTDIYDLVSIEGEAKELR